MSINEMIDWMNDVVCPQCTGKCKGCDCDGVHKIMDKAEKSKLTDKEKKDYFDFMRG